MKKTLLLAATLAIVTFFFLSGCSWYKTNRCWIGVNRYNEAKAAYEELESLDLTRQQLKQAYWRPCEINTAIYWIQKDYKLDDARDLE